MQLDLLSEEVNGHLPLTDPAFSGTLEDVKRKIQIAKSDVSMIEAAVSFLFLEESKADTLNLGRNFGNDLPKMLNAAVIKRVQVAARSWSDATQKTKKTNLRQLLRSLVSFDLHPSCEAILAGLAIDRCPSEDDVAAAFDAMGGTPNEKIRDRSILRDLFGKAALGSELKLQRKAPENRQPAASNTPAAQDKIGSLPGDWQKVDCRDLMPHRARRDIALLEAEAAGCPEADMLQISEAMSTRFEQELQEFCNKQFTRYKTPTLADGGTPTLLTLMMLHGINQAAALTMTARAGQSKDEIVFEGKKARANYKDIKIVVTAPHMRSFLELSGKLNSGKFIFVATKKGQRRLIVEQERLLRRFSGEIGLHKKFAITPAQLRPAAAQRWIAEGASLHEIQRRLHHDTLSQTHGYVDGLAYRLRTDRVGVAMLAELDAKITAADADVADILTRSEAGETAFNLVGDARYVAALGAKQAAALPKPRALIDRRKEQAAMPLPYADLTMNLVCALVLQLRVEATAILSAINSQGTPERRSSIERFSFSVDSLIMLSGIPRSELSSAKSAEYEHVNGCWRLNLGGNSWKPVSRYTILALRWWKIVTSATKDSRTFSTGSKWISEQKIKSLLAHLRMPLTWDRITPFGGEKWVFSSARIEKMLVSLSSLLGSNNIEGLCYLLGDHKFQRAQTIEEALLRTVAAGNSQSDLLTAILKRAETVEDAIKRMVGGVVTQDNGQQRTSLPSAENGVCIRRELAERIRILKTVLETGVCPAGMDVRTKKAVLEWYDTAHGTGPIGSTKKLTCGHLLHGSSIATIQELVQAIKAKVATGGLVLTARAFANDNHSSAAVEGATLDPNAANLSASVNRRTISELFAKVGHTLGGGEKPYKARLTQLCQFNTFCLDQGVELLACMGSSGAPAAQVSLIAAWHESLKGRGFRPITLTRKVLYLRDALIALLPSEELRLELISLTPDSVATDLEDAIKDQVSNKTWWGRPSDKNQFASDNGFAGAFHMAAQTKSPLRNRLMIKLTMTLGLRVSELAQFPALPTAVTDGSVSVELAQKGGSVRTVHIHAALANELRQYAQTERAGAIAHTGNGGPPELFVSQKGQKLSSEAASAAISRCLSLASQHAVRPHAARSLAFSDFAERLIDQVGAQQARPKVAILCGHANVHTTSRHYLNPKAKERIKLGIVALNDNCSRVSKDDQVA